MTYVDGFVMAIPTANKQAFIDHAEMTNQFFMDHGALRVRECWGDDVPDGRQTDFRKAVQAGDAETVVFSWVEWPDKATRDACMARMEDASQSDDRIDFDKNPMPFDGMRMIYGGFSPIVALDA